MITRPRPPLPHISAASLDPRLLVLAGAAATSLTGSFIKLSGVSPATSTFFRCALALPILGYLALREFRRHGGVSRRVPAAQVFGGMMLGADFALWAHSITMIGAGISTVVVNVQVMVVPLLAWIFFRATVPVRFVVTVPFLFAGVALAGGVLDGSGDGHRLLLGTLLSLAAGVAYGVYIFVIGRAGSPHRASSQVFVSTIAAGVVGTAIGSLWGTVDFIPGWSSLGWLATLSLSSQLVGWVLIGFALPRLASEVGATLLLAQPVMAMGFSMLLVHERPSVGQFAGCAVVIVSVWVVTRSRPAHRRPGTAAATVPVAVQND
ncbi:DMT family transporter [Rhodococcus jostii]|uniref:DMT family transporter n=1 Tax=Rhodococcus jostii TaxID=132919 RepID=A0ABU4CTW3_RHOJO|nr:DMT family transporter [Rhodococcus jostii]MDV6286923.1 DMT family transporter [Rhodococcus jostii]